jgi:hypothetical protein
MSISSHGFCGIAPLLGPAIVMFVVVAGNMSKHERLVQQSGNARQLLLF